MKQTVSHLTILRRINGETLAGFWREVYQEAYDTDRPHTHPWEMLGFSIKPTWWNDVYGSDPIQVIT